VKNCCEKEQSQLGNLPSKENLDPSPFQELKKNDFSREGIEEEVPTGTYSMKKNTDERPSKKDSEGGNGRPSTADGHQLNSGEGKKRPSSSRRGKRTMKGKGGVTNKSRICL